MFIHNFTIQLGNSCIMFICINIHIIEKTQKLTTKCNKICAIDPYLSITVTLSFRQYFGRYWYSEKELLWRGRFHNRRCMYISIKTVQYNYITPTTMHASEGEAWTECFKRRPNCYNATAKDGNNWVNVCASSRASDASKMVIIEPCVRTE